MKLQTGANQVAASLSYNATSKQFSNKLVTRKFTINPSSVKQTMGSDEDFTSALISRKASIAQLDMGGGMEMLDGQYNQSGGGNQKQRKNPSKRDSNNQIGDPFSALF
jgi:hypothetical protein